MKKIKIACVFGTRPELIKVVPIIWALQDRLPQSSIDVICTNQHREMLKPLLNFFKITVTKNFDVMQPYQSLNRLLGNLINAFDNAFEETRYDLVIGQGDTTSVFAAAISSFQRGIDFAHVEAGLRSHNFNSPFPEEMNRVLVSKLAKFHFCPTDCARNNLIGEGFDPATIHVTGNTVIDTLLHTQQKLRQDFGKEIPGGKRILVTIHRRENHGERLLHICAALKEIALNNDVHIIFPVHPNPNVKNVVREVLSGMPNIYLCEPLAYQDMVLELMKSYFIITDSGGLQEEAPALGKPVLIAREETERPEITQEGGAILVGSDSKKIVSLANELLRNKTSYHKMVLGYSPFGRGGAAIKIVDFLFEKIRND